MKLLQKYLQHLNEESSDIKIKKIKEKYKKLLIKLRKRRGEIKK
jgi:hypothetical protein